MQPPEIDETFKDGGRALWESHAEWWQTHFTDGADPEYEEQILPTIVRLLRPHRSVLEIGTGDGQVLRAIASHDRDAQAQDVTYVGIDPAQAQIRTAADRAPEFLFARGEALALPYRDASYDAVVACLVFEHILEVDAALGEVARVLKPGGQFLFLLNHPLLQTPGSGWIDDQILDEQYWRIGDYLKEDVAFEEVEKDVFIPFVHRPLSRYLNTAIAKGLRLDTMEEPAPPPGFLAQAWEYQRASAIPRLLVLGFTKESEHS
jgi:SAM-dependent methyltransferase